MARAEGEARMNAIELTLPSGETCGYACANCGRVKQHVTCSDRARELEFNREYAEKCCLCACGVVMTPARSALYWQCEACDEKRAATYRAQDADPVVVSARAADRAARLALLNGPCPDAAERLLRLHAAWNDYDNELSDEDLAACRVGAEAITELARLKA